MAWLNGGGVNDTCVVKVWILKGQAVDTPLRQAIQRVPARIDHDTAAGYL